MKNNESRLKSIEYHAEVARSSNTYPASVIHHANADLANTDVPYLLELVREQAAQIKAKQEALLEARDVIKGWENGELVNNGDGVVWREPVQSLPPRLDSLKETLQKGIDV